MADLPTSTSTTLESEAAEASSGSLPQTNGIGDPSTSTGEGEFDKVEALKLASNLFVHGKRHLLVKDVASAIASLGEACQLLSEANGQLCPENAEAHFYYGKALLEQSRLDLAVIDGGIAAADGEKDGSGSDEDDSDDEEPAEEDGDDEKETKEENEAEAGPSEIADASEETLNDTKKEEDLSTPSPSIVISGTGEVQDSEKPSTSSGITAEVPEGEKEEEELSNLELAWEVLEVAKMGFSSQLEKISSKLEDPPSEEEKTKLRKSSIHLQKRIAETHSLLGEVATESENYTQSVEDFQKAIQILMDIEGADSREIAQNYFQMGLAYGFGKLFQDAIGSFNLSKDIIEKRIANLKYKVENKLTAKDLNLELDDPSYTEEVEISELQALLPELEEKVKDTIDGERENTAAAEEKVMEQEMILKSSPVKNPNLPAATDISHLVKKRKKPEEPFAEDSPSKRACSDADSSAVAAAESKPETNGNGQTNGNGSMTTSTSKKI